MKKIVMYSILFSIAANASFAASIQAVRDGSPIVTHSTSGAVYTAIKFPVHVTEVASDPSGPNLSEKYVLLSVGLISAPVISSPCRIAQIGQVALYNGQVGSVQIAVMAPASDQSADCSPAVNQLVNASTLTVTFHTAMLADGSGMDVAPLALSISNP